MRVRMNIDYSYMPDGITLKVLKAGDVEDAPEHIARVWLREGKAREDKMLDSAPAVKASLMKGAQVHRGPNVTLTVKRGTSPYEVPPPGPAPKKPKLAKKR